MGVGKLVWLDRRVCFASISADAVGGTPIALRIDPLYYVGTPFLPQVARLCPKPTLREALYPSYIYSPTDSHGPLKQVPESTT